MWACLLLIHPCWNVVLIGLILYRSYAINYGCCEFMSAEVLLCTNDTVLLQFSPTSVSYNISAHLSRYFLSLKGKWCDIDDWQLMVVRWERFNFLGAIRIGWSCTNGCYDIHEYMGSTNWIQLLNKEDLKLGGKFGEEPGVVGRRQWWINMVQIYYIYK